VGIFFQGWLIGFSIAMPVGPIGMLCIQHALMRGMLYGLVAGLGAALADAIYGAIAGFGLSMVSDFIATYHMWFQLGGATFLWYLGSTIFFAKPPETTKEAVSVSLWRVFFTTFALTLTNPMTIICFAGIYTGLGVCSSEINILPAILLTLGVLLGSAVWWLLLSSGVAVFGKRLFGEQLLLWLNRISGGVILAFALITSCSILQQLFL
jgi:threonine/homoserine/homoserine lactone efflux protein